MLNIINQEVNANQNYSEILLYVYQRMVTIKTKARRVLAQIWMGTFMFCVWHYKTVQPLWKPFDCSSKLQHRIPFNPVILLMDRYTKELNAGNETDTLILAFIQNSWIVEATQMYINWWMDKQDKINTYNWILINL